MNPCDKWLTEKIIACAYRVRITFMLSILENLVNPVIFTLVPFRTILSWAEATGCTPPEVF